MHFWCAENDNLYFIFVRAFVTIQKKLFYQFEPMDVHIARELETKTIRLKKKVEVGNCDNGQNLKKAQNGKHHTKIFIFFFVLCTECEVCRIPLTVSRDENLKR